MFWPKDLSIEAKLDAIPAMAASLSLSHVCVAVSNNFLLASYLEVYPTLSHTYGVRQQKQDDK